MEEDLDLGEECRDLEVLDLEEVEVLGLTEVLGLIEVLGLKVGLVPAMEWVLEVEIRLDEVVEVVEVSVEVEACLEGLEAIAVGLVEKGEALEMGLVEVMEVLVLRGVMVRVLW